MFTFGRRLTLGATIFSLILSSIASILLPANLFAADNPTYKDYSITTEEDCDAAKGRFYSSWSYPSASTQESEVVDTNYCERVLAPDVEVTAIMQAAWLATCLSGEIGDENGWVYNDFKTFYLSDLESSELPYLGNIEIGHVLSPDSGRSDCGDGNLVRNAYSAFGFSNMMGLLAKLGCERIPAKKDGEPDHLDFQYAQPDGTVQTVQHYKDDQTSYLCANFYKVVTTPGASAGMTPTVTTTTTKYTARTIYRMLLTTKNDTIPTDGVRDQLHYPIAYTTFLNGCQATRVTTPTVFDKEKADSNTNKYFWVPILDTSNNPITVETVVYTTEKDSDNGQITINAAAGWLDDDGDVKYSCTELVAMMNDSKSAYARYLSDTQPTGDGPTVIDNPTADPTETPVTCAIEGIGWIICPVVNFLGSIADSAYSQTIDMMTVRTTDLFNTDPSKGTEVYAAWSQVRSIANILFIIAFIIIIYSQLTGAGLSNYGIKKMIPRLVMAAILINLSWYISVAAIEISNVIGTGAMNVISGAPAAFDIPAPAGVDLPDSATGNGTAWTIGGWAAAALVVGASFYFFLGAMVAALISIVVSVLTLVLLLGLREALLLLIVVVSPLAFAANLLPNTEGLFKKWWELFKLLLIAFPIVGLMYGLGRLAAKVMFASNTWQIQLFGMVAMFAWIFVLKKVLESATAVGGIGGMVSKLTGKAGGYVGGKAKERAESSTLGQLRKYRAAQSSKQRGLVQAGAYKGKNPFRRLASGAHSAYNASGISGGYGDRAAAAGIAAANKEAAEETERLQSTMSEMGAKELLDVAKNKSYSAERRAAALKQLTKVGGVQHMQAAYDYLMTQDRKQDKAIGDVQQLAASDLLQRKPAGIGATAANAMHRGQMQGNAVWGKNYNDSLRQRLRQGKIDDKSFAAMDVDDHARFAQMRANKELNADDIKALSALEQAVKSNDNLSLSAEQQHAVDQAILGPHDRQGNPTAAATSYSGGAYNLEDIGRP